MKKAIILLSSIIIFSIFVLLMAKFIFAQQVITNSTKFTVFNSENEGFKFYLFKNSNSFYSRDRSKDISETTIEVARLSCDQNISQDECGKKVSNSDIGEYAYDIYKIPDAFSEAYVFKGYKKIPSGNRQSPLYVRYKYLDMYFSSKEFTLPELSYYGLKLTGKRASCDTDDLQLYECRNNGLYASSTENILYDLQLSNPFRKTSNLRRGDISYSAQAFSKSGLPVYAYANVFASQPNVNSQSNQLVNNELFRALLFSLLQRQEYFELIVDHNLWIQPNKSKSLIRFYGTSPKKYIWDSIKERYDQGYKEGDNCPSGKDNFSCTLTIPVFGFSVADLEFFSQAGKKLIDDYLQGLIGQLIQLRVSGRSGDWIVNLCFDNQLKEIYSQVTKLRDENYGNGNYDGLPNQGYSSSTDGQIRLTVDTNDGPGEVKIYLGRYPYFNATCYQQGMDKLMNYTW